MKKIFIVLMVSMIFLTGCSSYKNYQVAPETIVQKARTGEYDLIGKTLLITTSDGKRHEIVVTEVKENSLHGETKEIMFEDILTITAKDFSFGRTVGAGVGTILILGGTLVVLWLTS